MTNLVRRSIASFVRYVFRDKPVYVIYGMRRSGNHALIQWIANSIEESKSPFRPDPDYWPLKQTDSGQTVFINEINMIPPWLFVRMLLRRRRQIHACKAIIISAEDVPSTYVNYRIPEPTYIIYAHRSLLNIVASRLHSLQRQAAKGYGWSRQNVDLLFFSRVKTWKNPLGFIVWKYEKWLSSQSYRLDFLRSINLSIDLTTNQSHDFAGYPEEDLEPKPAQSSALERYRQVTFPDWILQQLEDPEIQELLTGDELEFVTSDLGLKNTNKPPQEEQY